jgi:hypothetical protein
MLKQYSISNKRCGSGSELDPYSMRSVGPKSGYGPKAGRSNYNSKKEKQSNVMLVKVKIVRYFLRKDGGLFWSFDVLSLRLKNNFPTFSQL